VVGVSPTVEATVRREHAFCSAISEKFPEIRICGVRYGLADAVRSREVAMDFLREHGNLSAFFASDPFAVRGTLIALRASHDRSTKLIGVAQERDLLHWVNAGEIDALVVQDSFSMGREAVRILGDVMRGGYSGRRKIETRVALATKENLAEQGIRDLTVHRDV
jgi:ABC-type sugar transport system substrate-binding protein